MARKKNVTENTEIAAVAPEKPAKKAPARRKAAPVVEAAAVETAPVVEAAAVETAPVELPAVVEAAPLIESAPAPRPTHEAIAARAYALWRERGGSAVQNWFDAERSLRA